MFADSGAKLEPGETNVLPVNRPANGTSSVCWESLVRKTLLLIAVLAMSAVWMIGPVVHAQSGVVFQVRAGFDGLCKLNGWLPVYVVVENSGPDIDGEIRIKSLDVFGNGVGYTQVAVLPTQSRKQFTLYVYLQNYVRDLTVELVQKDRVIVEQKAKIEPLDEQQFLIGVLSDDMAAFNYLAGLPPVGKSRFYVAHLMLSDLPAQGRALGGLDALIVHNLDTASLTPAQRAALHSWVSFGGQLIVLGGPGAVPTAAGLGDLVPVRILGSQSTVELKGLGEFAGVPLESQQPAVVAHVEPVAADILAGDSALPLIVRRNQDRGRIDYVALDANQEPLRTWIGNERFWSKLFFSSPLNQRSGNISTYAPFFANPLTNIPSLDIPSVLLVMAFLFAYILVVGPLNLLVLKLIDKQSLAWITVPTLIILFSCTAYLFGLVSRGRKVIVSEITLLRSQPVGQVALIDSYVGIYSPLRRRYDVQLPDRHLGMPLQTQSYGGSNINPAMLWVEQGPPTYVRDLNVDVGAMKGFSMHTLEPWPGVEANLVLSESGKGVYHIEGTIVNRSNARIINSVLVLNLVYHPLGDLAAGESKSISLDFDLAKKSNYGAIADHLSGSPGLGRAERERQRKLEVANIALQPYYYYYSTSISPKLIDGLALIGWLDASPAQVHVQHATVELVQTTLLIAPLSVSAQKAGQIFIPPGFMGWQVIDGDPSSTPQQIYSYQPVTTFKFFIPDSQNIVVQQLVLHIEGIDSAATPSGQPPVIYIQNVRTGKWETFNALSWGSNDLPDPQRFIGADGGITVRVSTSTIQYPVSIDLSAVGTKK